MGLGDFLFKEKEEKYLKQIEDLQNKLKKQEEENLKLKYDLEVVTKDRDSRLSIKQLEIFEKNLKQKTESLKKYRDVLLSYRLNPEKNQYEYKVDLKNFYSEKKFEEILKILNENGVSYLNDLTEEKFQIFLDEIKNLDKAKQRFLDFKLGKFNWELVIFINKGERITKIYSKSKKLTTIFSDLYLEYMDDIADFDFMSLKEFGLKTPQIEEFIKKRDEYYRENRL